MSQTGCENCPNNSNGYWRLRQSDSKHSKNEMQKTQQTSTTRRNNNRQDMLGGAYLIKIFEDTDLNTLEIMLNNMVCFGNLDPTDVECTLFLDNFATQTMPAIVSLFNNQKLRHIPFEMFGLWQLFICDKSFQPIQRRQALYTIHG